MHPGRGEWHETISLRVTLKAEMKADVDAIESLFAKKKEEVDGG